VRLVAVAVVAIVSVTAVRIYQIDREHKERDAYKCAAAVVRVYKGAADPSPCFTSRGLTPPWNAP
jgi:hypothetical protein